jgi:polyisoprenoid-binding protein YceI
MNLRLLLLALSLIYTGNTSATAVDYHFDPVHSQLLFFADHMGFSTSIGHFRRWQGEFRYDPDDDGANHVDVSIEIGSLDLGDDNWNRTLLGRKWFNVEQYPRARFVSHRFERIDVGHARIHGELTLLDHTVPVVLEVTIRRLGTHPYTLKATAGFSATTTLSRAALGLDALAGTLADAVEIRIEVEGQRADPVGRKTRKR